MKKSITTFTMNKNFTFEQLFSDMINKTIDFKWESSFNKKNHKLTEFQNTVLDKRDENLIKEKLRFLAKISKNYTDEEIKIQSIKEPIKKKLVTTIEKYNKQQGLCVFNSIILYHWLIESGIQKEDLNFVQGILTSDRTSYGIFPPTMNTKHAYLTYKQAVIDSTSFQTDYYFNGQPVSPMFVLGKKSEFHKIFTHRGIQESDEIIDTYTKRFEEETGTAINEWIGILRTVSGIQ